MIPDPQEDQEVQIPDTPVPAEQEDLPEDADGLEPETGDPQPTDPDESAG